MMREMPEKPPLPPAFLSYMPSRGYRGSYKFHKTIGHAKNAISRSYGRIWQWDWDASTWVLLYDVAPHTRIMPWKIEEAELAEKRRAMENATRQRRQAEAYVKELERLEPRAQSAHFTDES